MSFKTSFQWFADYNTSTSGMQIIQFSAGGEIVRKRLAPMFAHYRKYKLGAIHVKFVPAATLPVDPTGLSYEEGEQTVDPRDMFNPGLVRHTNGEDVFIPSDTVLDSEASDQLYYSTMLDKRWHKFRLQRGITLRAFPKFWGVANLRQNMYPGFVENVPAREGSTSMVMTGNTINMYEYANSPDTSGLIDTYSLGSSPMGLFQTGQKIPMGWMPTGASLKDEFGLLNGLQSPGDNSVIGMWYMVTLGDPAWIRYNARFDTEAQAQQYKAELQEFVPSSVSITITSGARTISGTFVDAGAAFAPIPEIPGLLTLVMPRSRKTQFYYRVYVKEDVYFSDPVTSFNAVGNEVSGVYPAPIDVFTRASIEAVSPVGTVSPYMDAPGNAPKNDGDA